MAAVLAEACGESRTVFVVGKGGVGKTTSAGALAVQLAARGRAVHLLSTDPAHSLGDLFGIALPAGSTAPVCGGGVLLEAFDARAYAAAWTARVRPALTEILEAGTYLDAAEVAGVLDLSLPGIDEIMAALRLAELEGHGARRVVDTAPTGHTLRLLEAADLIDGWLVPLRAMAAKGATVASQLMGADLRLTGESALDEMAAAAAGFRRVLADATFLVVERADPAVRAETDRLLRRLAAGRLRVGALLHVGPGASRTDRRAIHMAPPAPAAEPCTALAALAAASGDASPVAPRRPTGDVPEIRPDARAFLRDLRPRILLFAGKGGVGKSTCAAAVALGLAETREVLLVSTDPAGSLADVLDLPVGGEPRAVAHGLRARQIDAAALLDAARDRHRAEIGTLFERLGVDRAAAMDRAIVESFWNLAPPGADEVMALIELTDVNAEEVVVVDAAPTGHFLRLLEMPELVGQWTRALLRIMAHYRTAAGLDEATARVLAFAKQVRALRATLTDGAETGVFLVTLDAPLVGEETRRLRAALAAAGIHTAASIVNRAARDPAPRLARTVASDTPAFAAPEVTPPPLGARSLEAFLDSWKRIA